MGEDSGDKTEEPTAHKLREARKKGQIVKSKDITGAALFFISFFTLKFSAGYIWENLTHFSYFIFEYIPREFSLQTIGQLLRYAAFIMLLSCGPIFMATFVLAIFLEALQTGFLLTFEPLKPSFDKINPVSGFKKFFSLKQYVEVFKSIIKMIVIIYILYTVVKEKFGFVLIANQIPIWQTVLFVGDLVITTVIRIGIFYVFIAVLDYFYQRWQFLKTMRMSKKEIKDEYKKLEGDPLVKQRQRDVARQMAMGRQMKAVPSADVVVTNPTHYAIAIVYKAKLMKAPMVIAKGKNNFALQIRRIAEENLIPIIENPPLAQNLYKTTIAGRTILPEYYKAVAEILAFVYNLKKKKIKKKIKK